MSKTKVLIVGCTGYIGTWITKACLASNHETILLVRDDSAASINKAQLIVSFKQAGARIVEGSLDDHHALVSLISGVDFVVSCMAENQILLQLKLVQAIKEAGTVKVSLSLSLSVENSKSPGWAIAGKPPSEKII